MPVYLQLTEHFSLEEMTHSDIAARKGLDNTPTPEIIANLTRVAATMERVRVLLGWNAVHVHSGYRSVEVNKAVGGVATSAHCKGLACDFDVQTYSNYAAAMKIKESGIPFDQLILEFSGSPYGGWVHLGLAEDGKQPRMQCLTKKTAASPYEPGLNP